jgi:hypothetical protein
LKLNEYAVMLMNAIRSNKDNQPVTITLSPNDMAYRDIIGLAIYDAICGTGAPHSLECMAHRYHAANLALLEVSRRGNAGTQDDPSHSLKPKRTVQKSAKNGSIQKGKIEKAVNKVKDKQNEN